MDSVAVPINDNTNPNRGAQQVHEIRHMDAIIGAARCARRAMQAHAHTVRAHKFLDERAAALAPADERVQMGGGALKDDPCRAARQIHRVADLAVNLGLREFRERGALMRVGARSEKAKQENRT